MKFDKFDLIGYISILIIILIIISMSLELTGRVSDSSQVNITIEPFAAINFTLSNISFGTGAVEDGQLNASLDTLGNIIRGNWSVVRDGFKIENVGNVNVTLDLKSGKTAAVFLGGSNPDYEYNISENETGSCSGGSISLNNWYDINTTNPGTRICNLFLCKDSNDTIEIDLHLIVPSDAQPGLKSDIFTATATSL